jgi:hypothetical protein
MSEAEVSAGEIVPAERAEVHALAVETSPLLQIIDRALSNREVDVPKLQALLDLQIRVEERAAEHAFTADLVELNAGAPLRVKKNGSIELPKKDGTIGIVKFAKWEDMDLVIRPMLQAHGFLLSFDTAPRALEGGGCIVTATLLHRMGHRRTAQISLPLDTGPGRNNNQAMGSTIAYGKRYTTEMLLNIVREGDDDDGVRAGVRYITEAQALEIEALLKETKADRAGFFRTFEIESTLEIKADQFNVAINMLNTKKRQIKAKAEQNNGA